MFITVWLAPVSNKYSVISLFILMRPRMLKLLLVLASGDLLDMLLTSIDSYFLVALSGIFVFLY